jgi:hypothetical protein
MSSTSFYYSSENLSPRVTAAFLARQRHVLMPGQFAREHQNSWVDAADSFTTAEVVADGMDGSWIETPVGVPGVAYRIAVDLGAYHNPSVIGIGHTEDMLICIDKLITFQGSPERPVQFADVKATLVAEARAFPGPIEIETWQGLPVVQELAREGWPVMAFTPTARTVADQWNTLSQALVSRRASCRCTRSSARSC